MILVGRGDIDIGHLSHKSKYCGQESGIKVPSEVRGLF